MAVSERSHTALNTTLKRSETAISYLLFRLYNFMLTISCSLFHTYYFVASGQQWLMREVG